MAVKMVAEMADKLAAARVDSMVETRVLLSDGKLVVRTAACWVDSSVLRSDVKMVDMKVA